MNSFVSGLNSIHGQIWMVALAFFAMCLFYARYRKHAPTPAGTLVEQFNSIHPAVYGFVLCMMAILLMLNGHGDDGEKVFLSGASFIGGVAMRANYNGNGNGAKPEVKL